MAVPKHPEGLGFILLLILLLIHLHFTENVGQLYLRRKLPSWHGHQFSKPGGFENGWLTKWAMKVLAACGAPLQLWQSPLYMNGNMHLEIEHF